MIIDKVVVHQTQSTLAVIGVALFLFVVFTGVMTWLRQYLVLHTGNRIDAVLASQVFGHLRPIRSLPAASGRAKARSASTSSASVTPPCIRGCSATSNWTSRAAASRR